MLKRILILLLALLTILPSSQAEQVQEKLIEAQEGEFYAMQIRSLESDAVVGILGVESEPVRRTWEDFARVFSNFMKKNFDEDVTFSPAIWSNGEWLYLFDAGYVIMRVSVTDDTEDALIRQVTLTGMETECAPDVQVLTAAAYWAAAQFGEYGKYIMQIVFMEDHSEDWFTKEPVDIWIENGYQLTYGQNEWDCPFGLIRFSEDLESTGGYRPFDPEGMENLRTGQTVDDLFFALEDGITNSFLNGSISVPNLTEDWQSVMGGRVYSIPWDDCALFLYTDGEGKALRSVTLACMSGDTISACMHLYPLYDAMTVETFDAMRLLSCIVDGHGAWEDMSALKPYCAVGGVLLQCDWAEIGGEALPIAYICGAIPE